MKFTYKYTVENCSKDFFVFFFLSLLNFYIILFYAYNNMYTYIIQYVHQNLCINIKYQKGHCQSKYILFIYLFSFKVSFYTHYNHNNN